MATKRMEPPVVWVEWLDSASRRGWSNIDVASRDKTLVCRSAGYLLKETRSAVTLSTSICYGEDDRPTLVSSVLDPITIPRRAVLSLRRLRR